METSRDARLAALKKKLDALERQAREDIRDLLLQSRDQHHNDLAGLVHDEADESVANMLLDVGNSMVERHVAELRDIESARQRLAAGTIEFCGECGGEIGHARLLAYPIAVRCLHCQGQHEKTHVHEATPRL
jgi:DnaK suppressor protein